MSEPEQGRGLSAVDEVVVRAASYDGSGLAAHDARPTLGLAILTCMDARVDPGDIFDLHAGEAHVVRSAGALPTPDVIEALAISQSKGGTQEIMVVHHTDCVALGHLAPGTTPEETARQTVRRLRREQRLPHRDRIRGFVFRLDTGTLMEVGEVPEAPSRAATARYGPLGQRREPGG
jgi:carbonic anhydrase